jgi:antagonist of KipI
VALRVVRPGPQTTVQDLGRPGLQRVGVSVGGAMDTVALRVANLLVGNAEGAAGLEMTLLGPTLAFEEDALFALGGADLGATLDGRPLPCWRAVAARKGSELAFSGARTGCRTYLALAGGLAVPEVLGGRGTDLKAGYGGLGGRALTAGDRLPLGESAPSARGRLERLLGAPDPVERWGAWLGLLPPYADVPRVRILPGAEHAHFDEDSRWALVSARFEVTPRSNRMGYRLRGPPLALRAPLELISSPVTEGTVQVPPGGDPIVLMADRQTTGGYPRIAQVITVDLPLLAQLRPGAGLLFEEVSLARAQEALLARERELRVFAEAVRLRER